ncbi:TPA: hypothetical protein ACH3X1_003156 [Trebouxia sp. C0004]
MMHAQAQCPAVATSRRTLYWKMGRIILIIFKAARLARPFNVTCVPAAGRRVLSLKGWLLPHSRVLRRPQSQALTRGAWIHGETCLCRAESVYDVSCIRLLDLS